MIPPNTEQALPTIVTSGVATSMSIIFLITTFLLDKYDQYTGGARTESESEHYQTAIQFMVFSLILATLALTIDLLSILGVLGTCGYLLSLGLFVAELLLITYGTLRLSYELMGEDLWAL